MIWERINIVLRNTENCLEWDIVLIWNGFKILQIDIHFLRKTNNIDLTKLLIIKLNLLKTEKQFIHKNYCQTVYLNSW